MYLVILKSSCGYNLWIDIYKYVNLHNCYKLFTKNIYISKNYCCVALANITIIKSRISKGYGNNIDFILTPDYPCNLK